MGLKRETESSFQKSVLDFARLHKWRCAHFKPAQVPAAGGGRRWVTNVAADGKGFPDLVLVRNGALVFAELKVGKNLTSAEQTAWLDDLAAVAAAAGNRTVQCFVWYPDSWPEIERVLGGKNA